MYELFIIFDVMVGDFWFGLKVYWDVMVLNIDIWFIFGCKRIMYSLGLKIRVKMVRFDVKIVK